MFFFFQLSLLIFFFHFAFHSSSSMVLSPFIYLLTSNNTDYSFWEHSSGFRNMFHSFNFSFFACNFSVFFLFLSLSLYNDNIFIKKMVLWLCVCLTLRLFYKHTYIFSLSVLFIADRHQLLVYFLLVYGHCSTMCIVLGVSIKLFVLFTKINVY